LVVYTYTLHSMNIILEKRQDILTNNNTAQTQLESILERLSRNTNIDLLELSEVFHGNLDFSILGAQGFHNIKEISFGNAGEITSITNLPDTLEKLSIHNQYLVELNDLPKKLVELDCNTNYLTSIDVKHLSKLKILNVSNNKIEKLENLPDTLEELYCDNNQISQLTLKENLQLRILHCSNNKTIIIDGLPPSIVDFKSENNPYIQQNQYLDVRGDGSSQNENMEDASRKIDFYEALHEYFKLKQNYETMVKDERKNAYMNAKKEGLGKKGRAKRVANVLPKCIVCKRYVGSIFALKNNHYIARCGDAQTPCKLNMKLYRGNCWETKNSIHTSIDMLKDLQEKIISIKLSSIFKFVGESDAIQDFNNAIEEYNDFNQLYMSIKETYDKQMKDPVREQLIERKTEQVYQLISAIKTLIKQYAEEGNTVLLQTAVRMQIEELNPEILNLRRLKYEMMEMDGNTLIQMYSSIQKESHCLEDQLPTVIKWSM